MEADLPQDCFLPSDMLGYAKSVVKCASASKRKRSGDDIADAITYFSNSTRRAELAKQKIFFMKKEDKRSKDKTPFDKGEQVKVQIWSLCEDLKTCNDDIKAELDDDIEGLRQQKKLLVLELRFK